MREYWEIIPFKKRHWKLVKWKAKPPDEYDEIIEVHQIRSIGLDGIE